MTHPTPTKYTSAEHEVLTLWADFIKPQTDLLFDPYEDRAYNSAAGTFVQRITDEEYKIFTDLDVRSPSPPEVMFYKFVYPERKELSTDFFRIGLSKYKDKYM